MSANSNPTLLPRGGRPRRLSILPCWTGRRSPAGARALWPSTGDPAYGDILLDSETRKLPRVLSVCATWSRAASTIPTGCVHRVSVATAPASMRAISRTFSNRRVSRSISDSMSSPCAAPIFRRERRRGHVLLAATQDSRQGCPQIVAERREQRGLEAVHSAGSVPRPSVPRGNPRVRLRLPPLLRAWSSVPASTGRPAAARMPIGFVPTRNGTSCTTCASRTVIVR